MRERITAATIECCWALGIAASAALVADVLGRWSEPHRRYHGIAHLDACIRQFDRLRPLAVHPGEVLAALLLHDAIYDPRRTDNEARSAELVDAWFGDASALARARIADAVMATRTHDGEGDAALVVDIDLEILGAPPAIYDAFEHAIREEFAFVPAAVFRWGRVEVLQRFAARRSIFRTAQLRAELEVPARANLARALADLVGGHPQPGGRRAAAGSAS